MVKVGHAFSDFVTHDNSQRRHNGKFSLSAYSSLFPGILLVILLGILLGRLFYLQVIQGNYYKVLSDSNRTRSEVVHAARGVFLFCK